MAYNTNTRLLLKFNESNGSTSTSDSSEWSRTLTLGGTAEISSTQGKFSTNSLSVGNTSNSVGDVLVSSPGDVFSDSVTSHKQFDFWFYREASPPWGIQPLVSITFQNGDSVLLWRGSTSYELEINSANWNTDYTYQSYTDYNGYQTWVHLRLKIVGQDYYVGLDGTEIMAGSSANGWNLWAGGSGNPVTQFRIGGWPTGYGQDANVYVRGYIDAYQVLEGDTSWTGGGYTVPTAEPDSYVGGGGNVTVGLTGQSFSISQGSLTPNRSKALTGQAYSYSQGTVTPSVNQNKTVALTGQAYTYSQGSLGKTLSKALTGQSYTYAQGALGTVVGQFAALTGQSIPFAQGSTGIGVTVPVSGQAVPFAQGSITAVKTVNVSLTGQSYSYAQGSVSKSLSVTPAGQSISLTSGNLSPSLSVPVSGQAITFSQSPPVASYPPPYNTYTRLQLCFGEANGSTTTADTSSFQRPVTITNAGSVSSADGKFGTNSLKLGVPGGTDDYGYVSVNTPSSVFVASQTTAKRVDMFFNTTEENTGPNAQCLVDIHFDDFKFFRLWVQNGYLNSCLNLGSGSEHNVEYKGYNFSPYHNQWRHVRVCCVGTELVIGLDGSEVIRFTGSNPAWPGTGSNTATHIWFGNLHLGANAQHFRGYIDCIEVLEGDTSWTGGSYTVPTMEPTSGVGTSEIFGAGANTTSVTSVGVAVFPDAISATGGNTVTVTGSGVGGDTSADYDLFTTLMMHCNLAQPFKDSSIYNNPVVTNGSFTSYTTAPIVGDGALLLPPDSMSSIVPSLAHGLFFDQSSDKIFDFCLKPIDGTLSTYTCFTVLFNGSRYGGGSAFATISYSETTLKYTLTIYTATTSYTAETDAIITLGNRAFLRLAFIGDHFYFCVNGIQKLTGTSYGGNVWPDAYANRPYNLYYGNFSGVIDAIRVQEGSSANHGYSGGNYIVDTTEWYPNAITGSGSNTASVTSVGDGLVLPEILATGANTLDNMLGEGNTNVGEWREAAGSIVLDDLTSVGEGNTLPAIAAAGASTTEAFASQGVGYLEWIGRGENTLEAFVGSGVVELKNFNEGAGVSTTSVSSSGVGFVAVSCAGENETSVTSAGEGIINAYMVGESETSVSSVGEGFLIRFVDQWNTTASVSSSGEAIAFFDAVGSSVAEVLSVGYGECQITGQGQSTAFVETYAGIPVGLLESGVLEYAHSKPHVVYVR